jgi:predicted dehydrogenase
MRTAVVGAGLMGYWHGHAIGRVGGQVMAIVDPNFSTAQALAKHHPQARVFDSWATALNTCSLDVVHICTPSNSHDELIEIALQVGCHVLAEKPLASSVQATVTLIDLAARQGLKLNPVHQFPFQVGFLNLIDRRHQLGEIVRFAYTARSAGGMGKRDREKRLILLEILPHPIALLHHFFNNKSESVFEPNLLKLQQFTDDDLELTGSWNGTRISIDLSLRGRPTCNELRIVGTNGSAYIDLFHGYGLFEPGKVSRQAKVIKPFRLGTQMLASAGSNLLRRALQSEPAYPGLRELIDLFYQSISNHTPPPISNSEILAVARLMAKVSSGQDLDLT